MKRIFKRIFLLFAGILCLAHCGSSGCGSSATSGASSGGGTTGGGTTGGETAGPSAGDGAGACSSDIGNSGLVSASSFGFVTGKSVIPPPSVARPGKCTPTTDPSFHTTIARVTAGGEYAGSGIENEYARTDPMNSDGTRLILRGNNGDWHLYNASTFEKIAQLTGFVTVGGEELEPRWDASDPNVFYFVDGPSLRSYNVSTRTASTVHDFHADISSAAFITTKTEGDASLDRRYWCFLVEDAAMKIVSVAVYDKTANAVVGQKKPPYKDGINWVSMDMSGDRCVIGYEDSDTDGDETTPPAEAFTRDFSSSVNLPTGGNGHMDLALTADGRDAMVYQNNATDFIEMADLKTGAVTPLVAIPFDVNGDIGLHFSGNSAAAPGWALVSTYGARQAPAGASHSWMDNQIFMVELKANPRIWRIAHNHSYTSDAYNPDHPTNYFAESFATINAKGTKIFFGSNWDVFTDLEYTDAYQILLPEGWPSRVP